MTLVSIISALHSLWEAPVDVTGSQPSAKRDSGSPRQHHRRTDRALRGAKIPRKDDAPSMAEVPDCPRLGVLAQAQDQTKQFQAISPSSHSSRGAGLSGARAVALCRLQSSDVRRRRTALPKSKGQHGIL